MSAQDIRHDVPALTVVYAHILTQDLLPPSQWDWVTILLVSKDRGTIVVGVKVKRNRGGGDGGPDSICNLLVRVLRSHEDFPELPELLPEVNVPVCECTELRIRFLLAVEELRRVVASSGRSVTCPECEFGTRYTPACLESFVNIIERTIHKNGHSVLPPEESAYSHHAA